MTSEKMGEKPLFGPAEQEELRGLRRKQIGNVFTEKERERFLELTALEEASKKGGQLSQEEKEEYLQLTREQTESKEWTDEKRARFLELMKRMGQQ